MTFEKHLQEACGATYPLRDMLNNLSDAEIEEEVVKFRDRDFMKQCNGGCDKETQHRVIHACNECDQNL
jgi:hypothetical protein